MERNFVEPRELVLFMSKEINLPSLTPSPLLKKKRKKTPKTKRHTRHSESIDSSIYTGDRVGYARLVAQMQRRADNAVVIDECFHALGCIVTADESN